MKKTLTPRKVITSEGKVAYSESSQAWNVIKLKKELFNEFPELKEKRSKFSYMAIFPRELNVLKEKINQLKDEAIPFLVWIFKEK